MPQGTASHLEAISDHADAILGPSFQHFDEKYSPDIHVDLLHYAPNTERDFHYIVTSGMSDRAMTDDGAPVDEPFMELVIALPPHWDVSAKGFRKPAFWEPFRLLKSLARYPHRNRTFFAKTHTVALGDLPLLAPMKAALFMPPVLVPEFGEPLPVEQGKAIHFMAVYLLQADELELKLKDFAALLGLFGERLVTELYDLQRPSVLSRL